MKNIFFLILLLISSTVVFSQKSEDKNFVDAKYKCTYSFNFTNDTIKKTHGQDDRFILLIGDDLTYGYGYLRYQYDSLINTPGGMRKWMKDTWDNRGKNGLFSPSWITNELMRAKVFKDHKEKRITVLDNISTSYFIYEEELISQNWIIRDDTMTIAGYACQKAQCSWRGRDYEAWFTPEIPISEGPWKFYGLPGLIVKLYDTKHQYEFELIGFESTNEKIDIQPLYTKKIIGFFHYDLTKIDRMTFLQTKYGEKGKIMSKMDMDKVGIVNNEPVVKNYDYIELDYK